MGLDDEETINGSQSNMLPKSSGKVNGAARATTDTVAFVAQRKNGVAKTSVQINGKAKKTNTGRNVADFMDVPIPAKFIAETNLPTDVGQFRLRAYRTEKASNEFTGDEPCVIYASDKPPFGDKNGGDFKENVPVRIHDQCLTSEVFRSQR